MDDAAQNLMESQLKLRLAENALEDAKLELKNRRDELELVTHENHLLSEMGDLLQGCRTTRDACAVVGQYAQKLFMHQPGILYMLSSVHHLLENTAEWGESLPGGMTFSPEDCWALRRHRLHLVTGKDNRLDCRHFTLQNNKKEEAVPYLCAPLVAQGEILGVFHQRLNESRPPEHWQQLALMLAERVSLALANLRLVETLRLQSIRDPHTNLFSRCYMEETLERELLRSARHHQPLGIIMIDIDHLKMINDAQGYDAGDGVLREMGTYLQSSVRGEDVACRFGGDEFVILFPEVSLGGTRKRAEQICQNARRMKVQYRSQLLPPITVSVGVASFPVHGAHAVELLRAVETGLQQAKEAGCDRVEVVRLAG